MVIQHSIEHVHDEQQYQGTTHETIDVENTNKRVDEMRRDEQDKDKTSIHAVHGILDMSCDVM